jgi:hypothetical protein
VVKSSRYRLCVGHLGLNFIDIDLLKTRKLQKQGFLVVKSSRYRLCVGHLGLNFIDIDLLKTRKLQKKGFIMVKLSHHVIFCVMDT